MIELPLSDSGEDVGVSREAEGRQALRAIVRSRDLILVTGKGGVGKTTVVAALARLAAKERGSALAVESAAYPRLPGALSDDASIEVMNVEAAEVLPRALGRLLKMPALLMNMLSNRLMRLFIRTAPAVSEMILLDEISDLVRKRSKLNRPVIVDLPASGHALTLLDAPRSVREMLRVGPLAATARRIEELLLDRRRCELVVVAIPQELPINETIELVGKANEGGYSCQVVIVNRVPPLPLSEHDQPLLELMEGAEDQALDQTVEVVRNELAKAAVAREQIERLRMHVPLPIVELPLHIGADPLKRSEMIARALG